MYDARSDLEIWYDTLFWNILMYIFHPLGWQKAV